MKAMVISIGLLVLATSTVFSTGVGNWLGSDQDEKWLVSQATQDGMIQMKVKLFTYDSIIAEAKNYHRLAEKLKLESVSISEQCANEPAELSKLFNPMMKEIDAIEAAEDKETANLHTEELKSLLNVYFTRFDTAI